MRILCDSNRASLMRLAIRLRPRHFIDPLVTCFLTWGSICRLGDYGELQTRSAACG